MPCRSRCPALVSLARARTSDDIRPRVLCNSAAEIITSSGPAGRDELDARASNLTVSQRPTTRATGHTVPAPAAAAAPEHRCAAARCQVPRHRRPAARRTPAHRRAHALRKPAARPRRDRTAKAAQRRPAPAAHTAQRPDLVCWSDGTDAINASETDCLAGHVGFEPANPRTNYPFEVA